MCVCVLALYVCVHMYYITKTCHKYKYMCDLYVSLFEVYQTDREMSILLKYILRCTIQSDDITLESRSTYIKKHPFINNISLCVDATTLRLERTYTYLSTQHE